MKKGLIYLGAPVLLLAIYLLSSSSNSNDSEPTVGFKTTEVLKGDLAVKISATGVVEPNFKVEVKSKASGEVLKFPFEEGDKVKKGALLLQLDKSDEQRNVAKANAEKSSSLAKLHKAETALLLQETKYETDLQKARSGVQAAAANLQESEDKLNRQKDLFEKKFASQETLDAAQTAYTVNKENLIQAEAQLQVAIDSVYDITMKKNEIELARADVERSEIALDEAQERLDETEIFAPISGVIMQKLVEEGQIIASGISNVSGGTPLATIADMSRLFIIADVDETDVGVVKLDQNVTLSADAFPEQTFQGKVRRIAPQGIVENSITIFKVKIEVLGSGKNILKPMMSANIEIVTESVKDALYISRGAVRKEDGVSFVVISENGVPRKVPIETGIENAIYTEVISGLEPGQEAILGDWEKILAEASGKKKGSSLRKILWLIQSK
ncbi:MAG: secretion protein HlyD [Nitrospinaceae bacterium]|nr:MAG: secretion protein HlyD [Nitrospinaceae bacterium]